MQTEQRHILTLHKDLPLSLRFVLSLSKETLKLISLLLAYQVFLLIMNQYFIPFVQHPTVTPYLFWGIILSVGFFKFYIAGSNNPEIRFMFGRLFCQNNKVSHLDFAYDKKDGNPKLFPVEALDKERFDIWLSLNYVYLRTRLEIALQATVILILLIIMLSSNLSFYVCRYLGWL